MYPLLTEAIAIERVTIAIRDLAPHLHHRKIIQLSDLHYDGYSLSDRTLQDAIAQVNAEDPDLILLTGDYVTRDPELIHPLAQQLQGLHSRWGVIASLGNHDNHGRPYRQMIIEALQAAGLTVLWNAIAYPWGPDFPVVGLADLWSSDFQPQPLLASLPPNLPRLVLSHNPDSAARLQPFRVDLQLSGHTHGGQIVLPTGEPLPEILLRLRRVMMRWMSTTLGEECEHVIQHWEWVQGHHYVGTNQLYVNRGLGSYFPGRFNCSPEITVLTLNPA
jgi:predicted MPP superfamily phosphohydrolase